MGTPEYSISTGHYPFPAATLTPLMLPAVSLAMREAVSTAFETHESYRVDSQGHALLCRDAFDSGLIDAKALEVLAVYPNTYGLHLLTQRAVTAIEQRMLIQKKGLIPGIKKRIRHLSQPFIDEPFVARLTAACIRQELVELADVEPELADGPACVPQLLALCQTALQDVLMTEGEKLRWHFEATIENEKFVLYASEFNEIDLSIPLDREDCRELNVLIFKTLDAMSWFLVPFHTPMSFIGPDGVYSHLHSEAYMAMKESLAVWGEAELLDYLKDTPSEDLPFEDWALGLDCEPDEDAYARAAAILLELHDFDQHCNFRLDHRTGCDHKAEMQTLIRQIDDSLATAPPYAAVLATLREALEVCIAAAESGFDFNEREFETSAEDSVGFFETLYASVAGVRFSLLEDDAYDHFDGYAQNACGLFVAFPLSHESLEMQVLPVLRRTQQCLYLLDKLDTVLEEFKHVSRADQLQGATGSPSHENRQARPHQS